MKEKMTSGEIAKQAGVSTKALRIYDEKGLLKPVGHSDGNYKLYDKSSLIILEKIIALKHIGFSLEEIKCSLENYEQSSIREILEKQLEMMDQKIYELQKAAKCIESALARFDENPDWDDIADIRVEFYSKRYSHRYSRWSLGRWHVQSYTGHRCQHPQKAGNYR